MKTNEVANALHDAAGAKLDRLLTLAAEERKGRSAEEAATALYDRIYGESDDNEFTNEAVRLLARLAVACSSAGPGTSQAEADRQRISELAEHLDYQPPRLHAER
jgi:hypothetical protein